MEKGLLGSWENCRGDEMVFGRSGEFRYSLKERQCEIQGSVALREGRLSFKAKRNGCARSLPSWMQQENTVLLGSDSVVFTSGGMGSLGRHFTRARLKREVWSLSDSKGFKGELRLCFFQDGSFMDGHYSSLGGNCNFMGTCQGKIDDVQIKEGSTQIWMRCWGDCPCNGVLVSTNTGASKNGGKAVMGHYRSTNCQTTFERTFTGELRTEPPAQGKSP